MRSCTLIGFITILLTYHQNIRVKRVRSEAGNIKTVNATVCVHVAILLDAYFYARVILKQSITL